MPDSGPDDFFKHAILETCNWRPEACRQYYWRVTWKEGAPNDGRRRVMVEHVTDDGYVVLKWREHGKRNELVPLDRWIYLASIGHIEPFYK